MRELEEALLEEEGSLHEAAAALAELDAALALAAVAADFGFVRPEVRKKNAARHHPSPRPLQSLENLGELRPRCKGARTGTSPAQTATVETLPWWCTMVWTQSQAEY